MHVQDVQFEWFSVLLAGSCFSAVLLGSIFTVLASINVAIMVLLILLLSVATSALSIYIIVKYLLALETFAIVFFILINGLIAVFSAFICILFIKKATRDRWITIFRGMAYLILDRPLTLILAVANSIVWSGTLLFGIFLMHSISIRCTGGERIGFFIFVVISTLWNERLIAYVGYTTFCGTFASWYIVNGTADGNRMPRATLKAFFRSVTVSLGSLALAALLNALLLVLSNALKLFCGKLIGKCGKKAYEKMTEYLNDYALVFIATSGMSLIAASKLAKKAKKSEYSEATGVKILQFATSFAFGGICGFVSLALFRFIYVAKMGYASTLFWFWVHPVMIFLSAFAFSMAISPFHSAVLAVHVCITDSPDMLPNLPKGFSDALGVQTLRNIAAPPPAAAPKKTATAKPSAAAKKTAKASAAVKKMATAKVTASASAAPSATRVATTSATDPSLAPSTVETTATVSNSNDPSAPSTLDVSDATNSSSNTMY